MWNLFSKSGYLRKGLVGSGTAFPTNPIHEEEFDFIVDATAGIKWRFKYNALSASAYKWEFIGGPPLVSRQNPNTTHTSAGWTRGAYVTIPRAGDYIVKVIAFGPASAAGVVGLCASKDNNSGIISSSTATMHNSTAATADVTIVNELLLAGITSDADLFAYANGCTFTLNNAYFNIVPVRV